MRRVYFLGCILLFLPFVLFAQRPRDKRLLEESVSSIQENPNYISAIGYGESFDEADRDALAKLSSQISVFVSSNFSQNIKITNSSDGNSETETIEHKINSFSFNNLPSVSRLEFGDEPEAKVLRYMLRTKVNEIFEARKQKILNYAYMGYSQEKRLQIASALRYYNWSLLLLQSYPYESTLNVKIDGSEYPAKVWLDSRIDEILQAVKVTVVDVEENEDKEFKYSLILSFSYNGLPISNFDYYYHNGYSYIGPISCKDGRGVADFEEMPHDEFRLRSEYLFRSQAENLDAELRQVFKTIKPKSFASATQSIEVGKSVKKIQKQAQRQSTAEPTQMVMDSGIATKVTNTQQQEIELTLQHFQAEPTREEALHSTMQRVIEAIGNGEIESISECFTPQGLDMFEKLVNYGKATVIGEPDLKFLTTPDRVICRSIPMQFRFKGNRQFLEDVTFRFDNDNKIESIAFTLNSIAQNDILKMKSWNEESRIALISFLEDYQTAYALKRIDYIESIFSDDAWIIIGTVLKKADIKSEEKIALNQSNVEYNSYTKQEYIERLRISFADKEFINIRFEDNDIMKDARGEEIYAIQIKQDYYSNNYGDTGYLTLLVDLRDTLPIIHIRVWQEMKDEEFTAAKFLSRLM